MNRSTHSPPDGATEHSTNSSSANGSTTWSSTPRASSASAHRMSAPLASDPYAKPDVVPPRRPRSISRATLGLVAARETAPARRRRSGARRSGRRPDRRRLRGCRCRCPPSGRSCAAGGASSRARRSRPRSRGPRRSSAACARPRPRREGGGPRPRLPARSTSRRPESATAWSARPASSAAASRSPARKHQGRGVHRRVVAAGPLVDRAVLGRCLQREARRPSSPSAASAASFLMRAESASVSSSLTAPRPYSSKRRAASAVEPERARASTARYWSSTSPGCSTSAALDEVEGEQQLAAALRVDDRRQPSFPRVGRRVRYQ